MSTTQTRSHIGRSLPTPITPPLAVCAYTAGMVDGDGYAYWTGDKRGYVGSPTVGVTQDAKNRGRELCEWFRDQWGVGHVYGGRERLTNLGLIGRPYSWQVQGRSDARHVLVLIAPYLIVKAADAAALLERLAGIAPYRSRWSPAEDAYLREHYGTVPHAQIAVALNRGTGPDGIVARARKLGLR